MIFLIRCNKYICGLDVLVGIDASRRDLIEMYNIIWGPDRLNRRDLPPLVKDETPGVQFEVIGCRFIKERLWSSGHLNGRWWRQKHSLHVESTRMCIWSFTASGIWIGICFTDWYGRDGPNHTSVILGSFSENTKLYPGKAAVDGTWLMLSVVAGDKLSLNLFINHLCAECKLWCPLVIAVCTIRRHRGELLVPHRVLSVIRKNTWTRRPSLSHTRGIITLSTDS